MRACWCESFQYGQRHDISILLLIDVFDFKTYPNKTVICLKAYL